MKFYAKSMYIVCHKEWVIRFNNKGMYETEEKDEIATLKANVNISDKKIATVETVNADANKLEKDKAELAKEKEEFAKQKEELAKAKADAQGNDEAAKKAKEIKDAKDKAELANKAK